MSRGREDGSTSIFSAVLLAGLVSAATILSNLQATVFKTKETAAKIAVSNAELVNLSALSLLGAYLESPVGSSSVLKVHNNQIQGRESPTLKLQGGAAILAQPDYNQVGARNMNDFFSGRASTEKMSHTKMEILETKVDGDFNFYIVRASTKASSFFDDKDVVTVGKIQVAQEAAPPPPVPPVPLAGCSGKSFFGFCYYVTANSVSCLTTCNAKGKGFDQAGTDHLIKSDAFCDQVLDAYGVASLPMHHTSDHAGADGKGCKMYWAPGDWKHGRWNEDHALAGARGGIRACACK